MYSAYMKHSEKDLLSKLTLTIQTNVNLADPSKLCERLNEFESMKGPLISDTVSDQRENSLNLSTFSRSEVTKKRRWLPESFKPSKILGSRESKKTFSSLKGVMSELTHGVHPSPATPQPHPLSSGVDSLAGQALAAVPPMFLAEKFDLGRFLSSWPIRGGSKMLVEWSELCDVALMVITAHRFSHGEVDASQVFDRFASAASAVTTRLAALRAALEPRRQAAARMLARQQAAARLSALHRLAAAVNVEGEIRAALDSEDFDRAVELALRGRALGRSLGDSAAGAVAARRLAAVWGDLATSIRNGFDRMFCGYVAGGVGERRIELRLSSAAISLAQLGETPPSSLRIHSFDAVANKLGSVRRKINDKTKEGGIAPNEKIIVLGKSVIGILRRSLGVVRTITEHVISCFLVGLKGTDDILNSRFFLLIDQLYSLLRDMPHYIFSEFCEISSNFVVFPLPPIHLNSLAKAFTDFESSLASSFYARVFPSKNSVSAPQNLIDLLSSRLTKGFSPHDFGKYRMELIGSAVSRFHKEGLDTLIEKFNGNSWKSTSSFQPIQMLKYLNSIIETDDPSLITIQNGKLRIQGETFAVSESMGLLIKLMAEHFDIFYSGLIDQSTLQKFCLDIWVLHQDFVRRLIEDAEGLRSPKFKKTLVGVALMLRKEVDFGLILNDLLVAKGTMEEGPLNQALKEQTLRQRDQLSLLAIEPIKRAVQESIVCLSTRDWRNLSNETHLASKGLKESENFSQTHQILPETANLLDAFADSAGQLFPALSPPEAVKTLDAFSQFVVTDYCKFMEDIAIQDQVLLPLVNAERSMIITRLEAHRSAIADREKDQLDC